MKFPLGAQLIVFLVCCTLGISAESDQVQIACASPSDGVMISGNLRFLEDTTELNLVLTQREGQASSVILDNAAVFLLNCDGGALTRLDKQIRRSGVIANAGSVGFCYECKFSRRNGEVFGALIVVDNKVFLMKPVAVRVVDFPEK